MRMILLLVCSGLLVIACATEQDRFVFLDSSYPSQPMDCKIDVFRTGVPEKKYARISRIDVHLEKTLFVTPDFENVLPELRKQACISGADAIIEVQERSTRILENKIYHITAIGIKYLQ